MNLDNVYVEFDVLKMISCALMIFSGKELLQYSLYVQFYIVENLPFFPAISVFCCIYWELAVAVGGFFDWFSISLFWISIPVVVGLMNPCILDLQNNYGLLLLFSLEEGFGGLVKVWIRICNVLMYLLFSLKLLYKIYFFFVFSCFYCII